MTELIKKLLGLKTLLSIGLVYTIFITTAFLLPASEIPKVRFVHINDKVIHVLIHFILAFIWMSYFFIFNKRRINFKNILIIILLCIFYGIIIEIIQQLLIASRHADIFDILANTTGSLLGALVFWNVKNRIKT